MPKKWIVPPIAGIKRCKTHFHNFTQVAMNQGCAIAQIAVSGYDKTLACLPHPD